MAERRALVRFETTGSDGVRRTIEDTANAAERASDRSSKAAERIGKSLGVALAAGATTAAVLIGRAINYADDLNKLAQRTGVSVEGLSRLDVAARLSDTSIESLQKGIARLASVQLEAAKGSKDQTAMLAAFGLEAADLEKMKPDEVLLRIAEGFKGIQDPAQRSALAAKVFGKELGQELIPFLSKGSEEIAELQRRADELGATVSQETAAAASAFKDELTLLGIGVDGISRQVAADLLPTLTELVQKFNDPAFREGIESIVSGAVRAIAKVAELTAELGNLAAFAGEEVAARVAGPGKDDIVRLEALRDRRQTELDNIFVDLPALFSISGSGRRDALAGEIAAIEADIDAYYQRMAERAPPELPIPEPAAATAGDSSENAAERYLRTLQAQEEAEKRAAAGRRAAAAETRAKAAAERELARIMAEQQRAAAQFQAELEDLRAAQAGPVAQANLEYQRQVLRITELHELGKVGAEDLAEALDLLTKARDEEVAAIEARLSPAEQVLADLREELELLGLTRLERDKLLARRAMGPDATPEQQAEADRLLEERDRAYSIADGMDAVREAGRGLLTDWASGAKSFGDAAEDALKRLRARVMEMIAERLIEQLFGSDGSTGTGSAGGWFGSFFSMLFGGGSAKGNAFTGGERLEAFAMGGIPDGPRMFPMARGRWGVMNEALDQEAILPLKRGPDGRLGVQAGGGAPTITQQVTFVLPGRSDLRTRAQVQADMARLAREAQSRGTAG